MDDWIHALFECRRAKILPHYLHAVLDQDTVTPVGLHLCVCDYTGAPEFP